MNIQTTNDSHQEIRISDRSRLFISGVEDVTSFDENTIIIKSSFGTLAVDGSSLKVESLSTQTGELFIEGTIGGVVFLDESEPSKKRGLFRR